jgi:glycosyltransferase involved in cell wall biosynthesis
VNPGVLAVVPAHDEADVVARTVRHLYHLDGVDRVAVVDDGSSDGTADIAHDAGAFVLRTPRRLGKGGALEGALERLPRPTVYLLVDADVGASASEAQALVDAVRSGAADLAIGRLPAADGGGFGLVKRAAGRMIRWCAGFEPAEPLSGQRAATAACLDACRPLAAGFGVETAMTIDAVRMGFRVLEVDVEMRHRPTGRDVRGFVHRGRQGIDAARATLPRLLGAR